MSAKQKKSTLTSETAEKVLLADLSNILQKAKSGKPLTRYERDLVAKHAGETEQTEHSKKEKPKPGNPFGKAGSMKQAAALMGVSVSLLKIAKQNGCPGFDDHHRVDCAVVEKWLTENELEEPTGSKDREQTKVYRLRAERLQFELDRDRGNFWERAEVTSAVASVCQRARQVWIQIPTMAPQLVGRPVDEIQKMLTTAIDKGLEELHKNPFA